MGGYGTGGWRTREVCGHRADLRRRRADFGAARRAARRRSAEALGVWAFHGGKDTVVPLEESQRMVDALKKAGVQDVKLTVYPEAGHDSWTETYDNPELYEWLLKHERGEVKPHSSPLAFARAAGLSAPRLRALGGAVAQHLVDVVQVGRQFGALGAGGGEVVPVVLEQRLLQIAVAQPAGAQPVLEVLRHVGRGDQLEQLDGEVLVRVRLGLLGRAAVHDDAHDLLPQRLFVAEDLDGVAVALAHLLAVDAGHLGRPPRGSAARE